MRASPAFQVVLDRFGVWRGVVFALVLAGAIVTLAWLLSAQPRVSNASRWWVALASPVLLLLGACAARVAAVSLRWDGRSWHLGPPDSAGHEPFSGALHVALDLGPWMLLRFVPTDATWRTRSTWLPAQRRGLESRWHALRCAVYSPHQKPGDAAADF